MGGKGLTVVSAPVVSGKEFVVEAGSGKLCSAVTWVVIGDTFALRYPSPFRPCVSRTRVRVWDLAALKYQLSHPSSNR